MTYLGWYDPDKKKPPAAKLSEAAHRYAQKWGRTPRVALVNASELDQLVGVTTLDIRGVSHVAVNTYWVGEDNQ